MKKMLFGLVMLMTTVATVSVFATTQSGKSAENDNLSMTVQVSVQGTRCNGTVGCKCPGFAPITNGEVWQKSYCKHCTHKKSVHK